MNVKYVGKAWLITWDWVGDHASVPEPVVDILSARKSEKYIQEYVERLYAQFACSLVERVSLARYNKPRSNPYRAQYMYAKQGTLRGPQVHCGHNPLLWARLVTDLEVSTDAGGKESLSWKEIEHRAIKDTD
jgi:hypothetical protein